MCSAPFPASPLYGACPVVGVDPGGRPILWVGVLSRKDQMHGRRKLVSRNQNQAEVHQGLGSVYG